MKIKKIFFIAVLAFLLGQNAFSQIDTRLEKVSNTYNWPSPGLATLVIDVQAVASPSPIQIDSFQDAFQLDANLRGQSPSVSFSAQLFPSSVYTTTEVYTDLNGVIEYVYSYNSGSYSTIGAGWTQIVRVSIQYTMGSVNSTISWYAGSPDYLVYDDTTPIPGDQTGFEIAIPFDLTDFSLPVQMADIEALASSREGIVLKWTTESEVNNAGFYIWRSEAEKDSYARISKDLIPGHGNSSSKNIYSFSDKNIIGGKTYWYKIETISTDGKSEFHGPISAMSKELIPDQFALSQNYPNPFNPVTVAGYDLPEDSKVVIRVFTMLGKEVKVLVNQTKQAGRHTLTWDGIDNQGLLLPSGIYFLQMQAGSFSSVRKMTLIR